MLAKFSLLHTNNSHISLIGQKDEEKSLESQIKSLLSSKKKNIQKKGIHWPSRIKSQNFCLFLSSQNYITGPWVYKYGNLLITLLWRKRSINHDFFEFGSWDLSHESIMINTNFGLKPPEKEFFVIIHWLESMYVIVGTPLYNCQRKETYTTTRFPLLV